MVAAPRDNPDPIGAAAARQLADFARTLRDNGFRIGLGETRDALAILASSVATRTSSLKPALRSLFCATHSDWEKFDEIFEAFWRGRGMRRAQTLGGTAESAAFRGRSASYNQSGRYRAGECARGAARTQHAGTAGAPRAGAAARATA
jgi:uncharacterized protein with von Willebrand factor type A (vWA) domain